ncbi:hypothetical protein EJC49_24240 [Aquibium carbonis]|uniref:CPBP family intramembrane metalloprotease n=1 Tax=Aquibium carbonis TaxID=2495581 RepID=A0A3R9ZYJ6_9HYPH|nr:hypothetical protein [Aquibium carbonis]RST81025.1 hypothetical protein EJC49_24240 [Aquibium carbonis]
MTVMNRDFGRLASRRRNLSAALTLFFVWCAATWLLEGRIETLLRPDAIVDRIIYAILGNLVLGVIAALCVIRWQQHADGISPEESGFGPPRRSALWILAGAVLGFGLYAGQGAPSTDPVVVLNAYAQVFVVSAAEVLVCWVVLGSTIAQVLRTRGRVVATVAAGISVSILFGLYHFAHSPPFNTIGMVSLLAVVGLGTSLFFFVSRDVYGTIVFHNFLGTYGVVLALKDAGMLNGPSELQVPLLATALATIGVIVVADRFWLRQGLACGGRSATNNSHE